LIATRNPKDEREVLIHLTENRLKIEASNIALLVDTLEMDADVVA
jgi:DNA-binding MarR family transcriptional regulator